jgi:formylglycine-generating enzyme required for sulfatase activity
MSRLPAKRQLFIATILISIGQGAIAQCPGQFLFADDFDRPDSTELGQGWEKVYGGMGCNGCSARIQSGVLVVQDSEGGGPASEHWIQAWRSWNPGNAQLFYARARAMAAQVNSDFLVFSLSGEGGVKQLFRLDFGDGGLLRLLAGPGNTWYTLGNYAANTWYSVEAWINVGTGRFDVCIDSTCYRDYSFTNTVRPDQVRVGSTSQGVGTVLYDSFEILGCGATTQHTYWVQVASRASGLAGSQWRTDVGINNPNAATANVEVRFHPAGGGAPLTQTAFVTPLSQSILADVVGQLGGSGNGALEVRADRPVVVTSRTYNASATGTFGQFYAAFTPTQGLSAGKTAIVPHLIENAAFRSNLAFTNMGTGAATLKVELVDGAGGKLTEFTVSVDAGRFRQETQPFKNRAGQTNLARGYARVTVLSGSGVIISGSVIDQSTNDPTTMPWAEVEASGSSPQEITVTLPGNVPLVLVRIPAGTFMMGSPASERGRLADEGPEHQVTLTQDYYMGKYEVTQRQWVAIMGSNPSHFTSCGLDCPVELVSWNDICGGATGSSCTSTSFIGRLNAHLQATGQPGAGKFRLPTEAEWERAVRAGTTGPFSFDISASPNWNIECGSFPQAEPYLWWCGNNSPFGTKPVGQKAPNPYGLYDVHGNVAEWVADWHGTFPPGPVTDPTGPSSSSYRVARGGTYEAFARYCRSAMRSAISPHHRYPNIGFRLARSL